MLETHAIAVDLAPPPGHGWMRLDVRGRVCAASDAVARLFGYADNQQLADAQPDVNLLFSDHSFFEVAAEHAETVSIWTTRCGGSDTSVAVRITPSGKGWHCELGSGIEFHDLHRAFRDERSRFNALADTSLNAIFMSDGQKLVYINDTAANMLGYEKSELLGTSCAALVVPESHDQVADLGETMNCGDPPVTATVEMVTKGGAARKTVAVSMSRIAYGERLVYLGVVYDVTEFHHREKALKDYALRLRRLSQQVLEVQENERRNLARELHDEIGQQLTLVKLSLTRLSVEQERREGIDEALDAVSALTQQVRDLSLDLRPAMLDDLGLGATLRWYIGRVARLACLDARLDIDEAFPRLSYEAETLFFRIGQEAVTNVMRHAQATMLTVQLQRRDDDSIELHVLDDGRGFDPGVARSAALHGNSSGLLGMQERATLGGAELTLESEPGKGTALRLVMSAKRAGVRV